MIRRDAFVVYLLNRTPLVFCFELNTDSTAGVLKKEGCSSCVFFSFDTFLTIYSRNDNTLIQTKD